MKMDCEICGSKNANRKAKIENIVLTVCDNCVKLGEEVPLLVKRKREKEKRITKEKPKSKLTIGDVVEVS